MFYYSTIEDTAAAAAAVKMLSVFSLCSKAR